MPDPIYYRLIEPVYSAQQYTGDDGQANALIAANSTKMWPELHNTDGADPVWTGNLVIKLASGQTQIVHTGDYILTDRDTSDLIAVTESAFTSNYMETTELGSGGID